MSAPSKFPPVLTGTIDAEAIWSAIEGENFGTFLPPTYGYVMNGGKPTAHLTITNLDDSQATDDLAMELKKAIVATVREVLTPYFERYAAKRGKEQVSANDWLPQSPERSEADPPKS